jgi:hypothetical protein
MGLFLSEPVETGVIEQMLGLGLPARQVTGEEDGQTYEISIYPREALGLAVNESRRVGAVLLFSNRPQDFDDLKEPVDGLVYVRAAQPGFGPSFLGLSCGRVHREHVQALLGAPSDQPNATDAYWSEGPWIRRTGLEWLGVRSRADGTVERLELAFREPYRFADVRERLDLAGIVRVRGDDPEVHFFREHGVALGVEFNGVTSLLLNIDFLDGLTAFGPPAMRRSRGADATQHAQLRLAIDQGDSRRMRELLAGGATVQAAYAGTGEGPLHGAAAGGHLSTVRELLRAFKGSGQRSLDAKDGAGLTPLHWAARNGHEQVCEALVAAGADVDARDLRAMTPLHFAALHDRKGVASVLLENGAYANPRDGDGKTPIDYCEDEGVRRVFTAALERLGASRASQEIRELTERIVQGMRDGNLAEIRPHLPAVERRDLPASVEAVPLKYTIASAEAWKGRGRSCTQVRIDPVGDLPGRYNLLFEFERDRAMWELVKADLEPVSTGR